MIFHFTRLIIVIFVLKFITISIVNSMVDEDELEYERQQSIYSKFQEKMNKWKSYYEGNIIDGLEHGKYSFVDRNFLLLRNITTDIKGIVRRFYNRTTHNFEVLNTYARKSRDAKISFAVTEELWRQLKIYGDLQMPVKEFCELYKTVADKLIRSRNLNYDQIEYVNIMRRDIIDNIKKHAVKQINSALSSKTYYKVQDMATLVFETNESLFGQIICSVIDNLYNVMRFRELIQTMWTHKFSGQKVAALSCILRNLQRNIDNNPEATMIFAHYLYMLKKSTYDEEELKKIEENIQSLPLLVRNLFFQEFCIRNVKSKDYIAPDFSSTEDKHDVFSLLGGHLRGIAEFSADPVGEFLFRFRNVMYSNELLYAGENQRGILSKERFVYTWRARDNLIGDAKQQVTWRVTLHRINSEHQITITNQAYNEILCVSEESTYQEGTKKYQNAVTIDDDSGSEECRWTVDICPFGLPH